MGFEFLLAFSKEFVYVIEKHRAKNEQGRSTGWNALVLLLRRVL